MGTRPAGKDAKIAGSVQQPHIIGVQELVENGKLLAPLIATPEMLFTKFIAPNALDGLDILEKQSAS